MRLDDLPENALLLIDTSPIIFVLEDHPIHKARFQPLFEAQAQGRVRFATTTVALAGVMAGPLKRADEAGARRCRAIIETWRIVALDSAIAESAARLRVSLGLRLPDAIQAASALAINADALVTHDRDFSRVRLLRVVA
jgi:predicted nucleic acid-binding protein